MDARYVIWLSELRSGDVPLVGGKNSSLGELIGNLSPDGIIVPDGFATTAGAYREFMGHNDLERALERALERLRGGADLAEVGLSIRTRFLAGEIPSEVEAAISAAYERLAESVGRADPEVAVRSSATAEDLPDASFAGQQETYLNVRGREALIDACRRCFASLFTDRAISYRVHRGFDHRSVALSVGVQLMVRSDLAGSGVMFSVDTETGFPDVVVMNAAWGLGESVVSGAVDPDEYLVFKPLIGRPGLKPIISKKRGAKQQKIVYGEKGGTCTLDTTSAERASYVLSDDEILTLASWACRIESHYGRPMDIEWAKDGSTGKLYVVQARPETVQARKESTHLRTFRLTSTGRELVRGAAVGDAIAAGPVRKLASPAEIGLFPPGAVLVTGITDPDWEPIMKRAAAIVTDHGGRTSHAAIVSRELGLPAIVGTGNASEVLEDGQTVTVSCAEGDEGRVYDGLVSYEEELIDLQAVPSTRTKIMLNLANPSSAFRWWRLPADGVGLARIEFIVMNLIQIHPMALVKLREVSDLKVRAQIETIVAGYSDPSEYFVDRLASGVARIAASRYPNPVVVRMSDFKSNEYRQLIGGEQFEPVEENPMIGWRGASRYYSPGYREGFALECRSLHRVRGEMGLSNVILMIPFCRTINEADRVLEAMAAEGLRRGEGGLKVFVMAEVPSNILLAGDFATRFDGFSIGSNDLTQLTLGVDRDSEALAHLFDELNPAVTQSIRRLISEAHAAGVPVGLCGQKPSDAPEFAALLVEAGIDSISVTPDSFLRVKGVVASAETRVGYRAPLEEP
ncbi:MAG: phosphoenolpyruvate synthase [Actinomycetota bacterium]